jgi:FMN phosphatase YigB (HAD superfamily)
MTAKINIINANQISIAFPSKKIKVRYFYIFPSFLKVKSKGALMQIKTVLFDGFGTLFDTNKIHLKVCKQISRDISSNHNLKPEVDSLFQDWVLEWARVARATVSKGFLTTKEVVKESLKRVLSKQGFIASAKELSNWTKLFVESFTLGTELNKDALFTLQWLKSHDYTLEIVSDADKEMFYSLINRFGLTQYFDFFIVSDEIKAWKYSKKPFEEALKAAKSKPNQTLMVGNSLEEDIGGGLKSGLITVWFAEKPLLNQKIKPHWIITKLSEVIKIVEQISFEEKEKKIGKNVNPRRST